MFTTPEHHEFADDAFDQPFLDIPYDVIAAIVQSLDFEGLKSLTPVSRNLYELAGSRLWRFVIIDSSGRSNICEAVEEVTRFISRPERAEHLRGVHAHMTECRGRRSSDATRQATRILTHALTLAPKLSFLRVIAGSQDIPILSDGLSRIILPSLREFETTLVGPELDQFWTHHPAIRSLVADSYSLVLSQPIPLLNFLCVRNELQCRLIAGSPVTHIEIVRLTGEADSWETLQPTLALSTKPLEHLHIQSVPDTISAVHLYTLTVALLPQLRHLHLNHRGAGFIRSAVAQKQVLDALSSLQHLHTFEWLGPIPRPVHDAFFATCSEPCVLLRRVSITATDPDSGVGRIRKYTRKSVEHDWES